MSKRKLELDELLVDMDSTKQRKVIDWFLSNISSLSITDLQEMYDRSGGRISYIDFLIQNIPDEILMKIILYLPIQSIAYLRHVSNKLKDIIDKYRLIDKKNKQGLLYTFGENDEYQLGFDNEEIGYDDEFMVSARHDNYGRIIQVSCGSVHTAFITEDNKLYMFGNNQSNRINDTYYGHIKYPYRVKLQDVVYVSCGSDYTAAITKDGEIYTWGNSNLNQLGYTTVGNRPQPRPRKIPNYNTIFGAIKQVSCGYGDTAIVTEDGSLFFFGKSVANNITAKISGNEFNGNIKHVSVGDQQTIFITRDGILYTFMNNQYGNVQFIRDRIESISAGYNHFAYTTDTGDLYTFGNGTWGKLGDDNPSNHTVIEHHLVIGFEVGERVVGVSCGLNHTACITQNGLLYTFGRGFNGSLGDNIADTDIDDGVIHMRGTPYLVDIFDRNELVIGVSCGAYHTACITTRNEEPFKLMHCKVCSIVTNKMCNGCLVPICNQCIIKDHSKK